jgi:EAL domain-containing protein (putative c-di-GMP-specific phosphodiesterase class I)/CheY-like chemotaxis protein
VRETRSRAALLTDLPILVVDDDAAIRELLTRAIRRAGYAAVEAPDGASALATLEREEVAAVVLDEIMPTMTGEAVIRAVRATDRLRTLPVMLVTGRAAIADRVRGLDAGADDYLAKPVVLDEFIARIEALLRSSVAWRRSQEKEAAERRTIKEVLRAAVHDGRSGPAADVLAGVLVKRLGVTSVALVRVEPEGILRPLAVRGAPMPGVEPGRQLGKGLSTRLRQRLVEPGRPPSFPTTGPDRGIGAVLPLRWRGDLVGLIAIVCRQSEAGGLATRLPLLVELADTVVEILGPELAAAASREAAARPLRAMIEERGFTPHFQPIVRLDDRSIVGYEALTRFTDGRRPDLVFAEADRLGLGLALERATLEAAVRAAHDLPDGIFLSVNVSPTYLLDGDRVAPFLGARQDLVLELSEHVPVDDYAAIHAAVASIRPPVRLAVDDAGSGYSSLRHILALRPDYAKLDLAWVRGIHEDPARQALLAGLVYFGREVDCALIAEGIENEADLETLRRLGVPLGQGYLLGRPAPIADSAAQRSAPMDRPPRRRSRPRTEPLPRVGYRTR